MITHTQACLHLGNFLISDNLTMKPFEYVSYNNVICTIYSYKPTRSTHTNCTTCGKVETF